MLSEEELAAIRDRFQRLDRLNDAENSDDDRGRFDKALRVAAWGCAWDVAELLAEVDWLRVRVGEPEKERDEAEATAFAKLEADIRLRTTRMAAEQDVIWRAKKLVERMKGAVGDSLLAAHQWLDDDSYQLFAAMDILEVSIDAANKAAPTKTTGLTPADRDAATHDTPAQTHEGADQ
jgi:hypothetical protein